MSNSESDRSESDVNNEKQSLFIPTSKIDLERHKSSTSKKSKASWNKSLNKAKTKQSGVDLPNDESTSSLERESDEESEKSNNSEEDNALKLKFQAMQLALREKEQKHAVIKSRLKQGLINMVRKL